MARQGRKFKELEFEMALTGVLEDVYDLRVRSARDPLNRRTRGYATLEFRYEYKGNDVEVGVSIRGVPESPVPLHADFSDSEAIAHSAEGCDNLAWAVRGYLEDQGVDTNRIERRWDD